MTTTVAARLKHISKLSGVAVSAMLLAIGTTGDTMAARLISHSKLPSGTVIEHLMINGGDYSLAYTYLRSLVLPRTASSQWTEAQLGNMPVYEIYLQFSKIIHVANRTGVTGEIYIDFSELQPDHAHSQLTLINWLATMDLITLPMLASLPTDRIRYIQYMDAAQAGYVANLSKIGEPHPEFLPPELLPDLGVYRIKSSTDAPQLHTKAIVTVNGLLHMTQTDGTYLFIKNGAVTTRMSQEAYIGIISFYGIGSIEKIPITNEMIYEEIVGRSLFERLDIELPQSAIGKTVLLSVGGYLWLPEPEICWMSSPDTLSISLEKSPYLNRYYESRDFIDLSSLNLTVDPSNPGLVSVSEITSDATIRKYLTLSQSFVMVLDAPSIFYRRHYIESMGVPGNFVTHQNPMYPLVTGYGRLAEYWKRYEDDHWAINISHGHLNNHLLDYRDQDTIDIINAQRYPNRTYQRSRGYLLEIGSYI